MTISIATCRAFEKARDECLNAARQTETHWQLAVMIQALERIDRAYIDHLSGIRGRGGKA